MHASPPAPVPMNRSLIHAAALLALAVPAMAACGGDRTDTAPQAGGDAAAAPAPAPAAVPLDSTRQPVVTSFAGFQWGTPRSVIVAQLGEPKETRVQSEGVEALGWDDTVAGQPASKVLYVHPQRGLIRGIYQVRPGEKASCLFLYQTLGDSMRARYPGLTPEAKQMGNAGGQLCAANATEAAGAVARWVDPGNGAQVFVAVPPGASAVNVVATTPEADAWEGRGAGPAA